MKKPKPFHFLKTFTFIVSVLIISSLSNAQIEIKEEIILSHPAESSSAGLIMPFYGKVKEFFECTDFSISQTQVDLIIGGTNDPIVGFCIGIDCTLPWFCYGQGFWSEEHAAPMGTTVDTEIRKCYDGNFVILDHYFDLITPPPSPYDKAYYIYAKEPDGEYINMGSMNFTQQTPPGCDPQFDCTEENYLPDVTLNQVPNGYLGSDACIEPFVYSAFKAFIVNDEAYNYNIEVCYNKQLQRWWFNLDNNHSFLINYILEVCESNLNARGITLIYDYTGFPAGYDCDDMWEDLYSHYYYGFPVIPNPNYVLEVILNAHEEHHKSDFQSIVDNRKNTLNDLLLSEINDCESFDTQGEAQQYWEDRIKYILGEFRDKIKKDNKDLYGKFGSEKRTEYERTTHAKLKWLVDSQILFTNSEYGCSGDLIYFDMGL